LSAKAIMLSASAENVTGIKKKCDILRRGINFKTWGHGGYRQHRAKEEVEEPQEGESGFLMPDVTARCVQRKGSWNLKKNISTD
jgi:hypothetical protein